MISFINTKNHKECIGNIKKLYNEAFPKDEQVPFFYLKQRAKQSISDIFGIYDEDRFIGLLCMVYHKDIVFLWYLAIAEEERGKGYGSLILSEIAQKYKNYRLILNIEEIDENNKDDQQKKRKQFYLKNGYRECGFKTKEYGVVYEMLCLGEEVTYEEYAEMMKKYSNQTAFEKNYQKL